MSAYLNTYTRPTPDIPRDIHLHTPPEKYDFNYVFDVAELKSDQVELRPFVPSLHAQLAFDGYSKCPDVLRWLGFHAPKDLGDFLVFVESTGRSQPNSLFYAIFTEPPKSTTKVDPKDYVMAGMIAMINSDYGAMISEPGFVMIFEEFHRTHVQTHASGLVMHRILDHPSEGGLGLRRCQWLTTTLNTKSQAASKRLGFHHEGVLRCQKVLPPGKEGARDGRPNVRQADCPVRDDWYSSVTWYEWEEGVRDHVDALMARR
ncbi:hypothetical protein IAT38_005159 [Cryptococcus sp. DSM 104549]